MKHNREQLTEDWTSVRGSKGMSRVVHGNDDEGGGVDGTITGTRCGGEVGAAGGQATQVVVVSVGGQGTAGGGGPVMG